MDHWDAVLPGRVHRVQYEEMVAETETQIRALLQYCGFEFEEQCLRFYETERSIRTPSAEQVRKPIYSRSLGRWKNYRGQLDEMFDRISPTSEPPDRPEEVQRGRSPGWVDDETTNAGSEQAPGNSNDFLTATIR